MDQPRRLVLDELEDRVEQIFAATDQLREVLGDGKSTRQILDSIFRNVHSIKAAASANGLDELTRVVHQFENLLHALRVGTTRMSDEVLRAFDESADFIYAKLRNVDLANQQSCDLLIERLQSVSKASPGETSLDVDLILSAIPADIWQALSEEEKYRLGESVREGTSLFLISTKFDLEDFDRLFQLLKDRLLQKGELISTAPTVHKEDSNKIDFRILYAREIDLVNVKKELSEQRDITVTEISAPQLNSTDKTRNLQAIKAFRTRSESGQLIRVDLEELDRLISSTQKLFRETNNCFDRLFDELHDSQTFKGGVDSVSKSFMRLAADLVNLRMLPVDRVLQRAFRAGRSAAVIAGKEVDFRVLGSDIKIDKSLSDTISDPLFHLVRNAVDHGIESPTERREAGKKIRGSISIEASTIQGRTKIRVTDDGRGIDPELVCKAASRLGLLPQGGQLDIDQSVRMIFRAGFSTANTVSEISGRGVGLDVVESAIEQVGGAVRVESEPGVGSSFEIILPVTFSLLDVLVIKEQNNRYLIDAHQVISIEPLNQSGSGASKLNNNPKVSRMRLNELMGLEDGTSDAGALLLCDFGKLDGESSGLTALQTSELLGTEQVLVRNLGSRGGRWPGVAGAAEMRDGTVALLLDVPGLIAAAKEN